MTKGLEKIICFLAVILALLIGACIYGELALKRPHQNAEIATEQLKNEDTTVVEENNINPSEKTNPVESSGSCEENSHTWGEASYSWVYDDGACEAKRVCELCGKEEIELTAAVYTTEGNTLTIIAEFKNSAFEAQSKTKNISGTDACFVVSNAIGKPGDTVEVTVSMKNNPGIIAIALDVHYDTEKLELVEVKDAQLLPNPVFSDTYVKNPYYISWSDATSADNYYDDGCLATFVFKIREQADIGTANVSLSYSPGNVIDWDLESQLFSVINGVITVDNQTADETLIQIPKDPTIKDS